MPKAKKNTTDIIIVGAGIAGTVLAFHLATAGKKVKVFEKKKYEDLGEDWCDSINKEAFEYAKIPFPEGEEKKSDISYLSILSPDLKYKVDLGFYNYLIVDRAQYQKRLIKLAQKAGAVFEFETEIIEPIGKGQWVVGVKKKNDEIEHAKVVVDCSGNARVLVKNIEILDLNIEIQEYDVAEAYRELHKFKSPEIKWGNFKIKKNVLYYRYGYQGGYSWLNIEDENLIDVGAGVNPKYSSRKPKAIVNEYVNSTKGVEKEKLRGGGGKIILRHPITLAWYGFLVVGEAGSQVIPTNGCGCGMAIIAAKIAAEVLLKALQRKEVSIDRLWEYQTRFIKERGKDLAALDAMRRVMLGFTEEELSLMIKKGIISKRDLENIIHGKYPKQTLIDLIIKFFRGIRQIRMLLKLSKGLRIADKIYKHYKHLPQMYDTQKYHSWLLKQLYLFNSISS
ncbi:MAG: NAD(P)/FAD-dependent oxidoreductase [Candidatus Heimdallarchaeaceae archaeon]